MFYLCVLVFVQRNYGQFFNVPFLTGLTCPTCTLITEVFPGKRKMERKEKLLKVSFKIMLSMTQYNFRTRLEPNLFSDHFDKAGTVLANKYAHSSCARMTQGDKIGYTTSLTSVTSPNFWTTYRAYTTEF